MKTNGLIAIFIVIFFVTDLKGEIEQIQVRWNTFKCSNSCLLQIETNLKSIQDVTHVVINMGPGTAVMGWKSNHSFSYEPFKLASSAAGTRFDEMRLRVSGIIRREGDHFYLISHGDHTRFLLISAGQMMLELKNQLLAAEKNRSNVMISGPLYSLDLYPLTLVIEQINIQKDLNPYPYGDN